MKPLTKIEKRFAAAFGSSIDLNKLKPDRVRCVMTKIAYHEAGHFAARRFTTLELSHVIKISIIGNTDFSGYVMSERNFAAPFLESYPPPIKQSNGRMLLLMQLAGYGAEMLLDKSGEYDGIFDYYDFTYGDDWYGAREEGTDLFKAERIAKIMAKPFMPDYRILNLASKWTLEMLQIPAIWQMVETVADKLIKRGEIKREACQKFIDLTCDEYFPDVYHLPKWKRRLLPKPCER